MNAQKNNEDEILLIEPVDDKNPVKTLANIREYDSKLADTYYLKECRDVWSGACLCANCRCCKL